MDRLVKPVAALLIGIVMALILGEIVARLAVAVGGVSPQFVSLLEDARLGQPRWRQGHQFIDRKTVGPTTEAYAAGARYFRNTPDQHSLWYSKNPYTHDQFGFRNTNVDSDISIKKGAAYRVAILGDSMTYGVGVENDQTYPAVTQRWLDAWAPNRFEIINGGVPGFSIQHLEPYYRHQITPFGVDHVIHGVFMPDFARPQYYQKPGDNRYYRPGNNAWRSALVQYSTLAALGIYLSQTHQPIEGHDEPAERTRSVQALVRFLDAVRSDTVTVDALLLPHRLVRDSESHPDQRPTEDDLIWNREQFEPATEIYRDRDLKILDGSQILADVSTGQCFETGRVPKVGHYSAWCNLLIGKTLAEHIYYTATGEMPPDLASEPLPPGVAESADNKGSEEFFPLTVTVDHLSIEMIPVPAGDVQMGAPKASGFVNDDEAPRTVTVAAPFFIMRTEVTNELWNHYLQSIGHETDLEDHLQNGTDLGALRLPRPYINVSQANEFVDWLSQQTGVAFFIPEEAQWMRAARLDIDPNLALNDYAVYDRDGRPLPPCQRATGRLGLCDILGNMAEMTVVPGRKHLVIKGGSYVGAPTRLRPSSRRVNPPGLGFSHIGLRLAARKNS